MDILIIAAQSSDRLGRFERFIAEKLHRAIVIGLGARLPTDVAPLGVVYFDQGEGNLLERLRETRERVRYLGAALVVVTQREKPDEQKELRAAGADLLCDPGTPDALIFKELLARCQALEVAPEQRQQLVDPLTTAVCQAIQEMTRVEVGLQYVYRRAAPAALGDIAAVLELSASLNGNLIMSFSTRTAEAFARQVFAEVQQELTPSLVPDCMGEITNVVAGQAKALLHGTPYHFSFSPPLVQTGASLKLPDNLESLVLAFDSDVGGFALQMCLAR